MQPSGFDPAPTEQPPRKLSGTRNRVVLTLWRVMALPTGRKPVCVHPPTEKAVW